MSGTPRQPPRPSAVTCSVAVTTQRCSTFSPVGGGLVTATRDHDAILGLSATVLERVDAQQIELLDVLGPGLVEARTNGKDGALGFGEADVAWLTAVVPVASVVVDVLLEAAKGVAGDLVKDGATAAVRRLRERRQSRARSVDGAEPDLNTIVPLPAELLERAQSRAYEHALEVGLDVQRAQTLAKAVADSLGTPPTAAS